LEQNNFFSFFILVMENILHFFSSFLKTFLAESICSSAQAHAEKSVLSFYFLLAQGAILVSIKHPDHHTSGIKRPAVFITNKQKSKDINQTSFS